MKPKHSMQEIEAAAKAVRSESQKIAAQVGTGTQIKKPWSETNHESRVAFRMFARYLLAHGFRPGRWRK
jgi:hypothetical protein